MPPKGKTSNRSTSTAKGGPAKGKPGRKPPPPITARPPRPWGLIAATMAVVVFAAGVIGYALYKVNESSKNTPEAKAAAAREIDGIAVQSYQGGMHNDGTIKYDQAPPFGGEHANAWADCTGTVYASPIRQENAVHALEHGAVWITYRPDLPADQVEALRDEVEGVEYMMMSPYPGLKSAVSMQSWGFQLFVDSASDPRVDEFINLLRQNPNTTPEYGASCTNPQFKASPLPPGAAAPSAIPNPSPTQG